MKTLFIRFPVFISVCLFMVHSVYGQSSKIEIVDYYTAPCGVTTNPNNLQDHLVSEILYGDTLQVIIQTSGNCGGIKYPIAKIINDTLWLTYNNSGATIEEITEGDSTYTVISVPECDCCFEHVFLIKGICSVPNGVYIPRGRMSDPHYYNRCHNISYKRGYSCLGDCFEIINSDTVNLVDKFGLKQGLWIRVPKSSNEEEYITIELEPEEEEGFINEEPLKDSYKCFFVNDEIKTGEIIEYYQPFNILKYHKVYTDFNTYKETFYDIDGNVIRVNESPPKEK